MIKHLHSLGNPKTFFYDVVLGLIISLLFSFFIYAEHYGYTLTFLNTLFALSSLTLLIYSNKRTILITGFIIGLLWFYWIGYSFEYQGVGYMTPIITLAFGFIYLLFFGVLALTNKIYLRAILLFGLSFVEPFAVYNGKQHDDQYSGCTEVVPTSREQSTVPPKSSQLLPDKTDNRL